jgi:hypothetical protein
MPFSGQLMLSESGTEHNYVFLIYLKLLLADLRGAGPKCNVVPGHRHNNKEEKGAISKCISIRRKENAITHQEILQQHKTLSQFIFKQDCRELFLTNR